MATFEKRISKNDAVTYRTKVRIKGHRSASASFTRLTDAKKWATQTESAMQEGKYFKFAEAKRRTLSETIDRYCDETLSQLRDPSNRAWHLSWWKNEIGHKLLADIHPSTIVACRTKLKASCSDFGRHKGKKLSATTVNRYLASLSPVFTHAHKEWGWLDSNRCFSVKRYKEPRGRIRFLSNDERSALLQVCENLKNFPEMKLIVLLAITTGMRRGEILNLRWKDIDLQSKRIFIWETKNQETRTVPLVSPAAESMKSWGKIRPIDDGALVFPSHVKGSNTKPLALDHIWELFRKETGLEDFRFHDLRHTAASYLAMSGAGLREIGDILWRVPKPMRCMRT